MTMSSEPPAVSTSAPVVPPVLARSVSAQSLSASGTPTSSHASSLSRELDSRNSASTCSDDASPLSVHSLPPTPAPPDVMHDTTEAPAGPLPSKSTAGDLNGSSLPAASSAGGSQGGASKRRVEQLQEMVLERELRRIELEEKKLIVETEKLELEKENLELERQKLQLEIGKLQANIRYSHPTSLY
ncbi:uncharacterized protein LOC111261604 isoform X1 [Varroa jacobsoni]|nr:uncharacterized protein LOC111261604 isoform X1 [Varroa jacobsoni]